MTRRASPPRLVCGRSWLYPLSPNYTAYETHRVRLAALLAAVEADPPGVFFRERIKGGATARWNGGATIGSSVPGAVGSR